HEPDGVVHEPDGVRPSAVAGDSLNGPGLNRQLVRGSAPYVSPDSRAAVEPGLEPGPVGPHAVVGLPLGRLTPDGLKALTAVTDTVIITPWRSLVVPHAADRLAELAGFATSPHSGWAKISACTGAPGCFRAAHDTEAVARGLVAAIEVATLALTEPVHLVACDRHCGATGQQRHLQLTSDSPADAIALLS
ncbi:MAG: hypothetical protein Q4G46_02570, partial [Propionibacteriaceae bacterium]|nr:hypothetical protein [Propionibacteriaceae bacterium]